MISALRRVISFASQRVISDLRRVSFHLLVDICKSALYNKNTIEARASSVPPASAIGRMGKGRPPKRTDAPSAARWADGEYPADCRVCGVL